MNLRDAALPSVLNTSDNDLIKDFFEPALMAATRYDRGVGYFSASWLRLAARGMSTFAENGGRARWVTSPILSDQDWQALQLGEAARHDAILRRFLEQDLRELEHNLETDTLSALSWLVADNILEVKLALPRNKLAGGEFHDKFGIFVDAEGNQVSFNGSYNDSIQGTRNYESIKVFRSWQPELLALVQDDTERFERVWNDHDPNVRVFDLPQAARERIVRLRTQPRPYPNPDLGGLRGPNGWGNIGDLWRTADPGIPPQVSLREYQERAVRSWFEADCQGILEMATGTGKTITALAAAVQVLEREEQLLVLVCCPFKHLVEQWAEEAERFNFRPIRVAESRQKWESELANQLRNFRRRRQNVAVVVTTNASLQRDVLPEMLEPFWDRTLIIVDEAHYAGAPTMLAGLPRKVPWRLGLSATPIRHYDEEGNIGLLEYFNRVVFQFGLKEAIGTYLTPYVYHPIPVEMTQAEFEEFSELTRRLQRYLLAEDGEPMSEEAKKIAIMRARVLNNSTAKLRWLSENVEDYGAVSYTLFYVGDKLFDPTRRLLGLEKHLRIHEFTHRQTNKERSEILGRFARGDLQALIAMRCLDEGVDVPPTRTAYFLASSGNPREFVQRRGRVLRRAEGKQYATIYDLISMPPEDFIDRGPSDPDWSAVRAAVRREFRRVKEFAELAENRYQAIDSLFKVADKLDLLDV